MSKMKDMYDDWMMQDKPLRFIIYINFIVWVLAAISITYEKKSEYMTPSQAYDILDKSVVEYTLFPGESMCTATNVAHGVYLTARHCIRDVDTSYIVNKNGDFVSVIDTKLSDDKDWAIIYTLADPEHVVPLPIDRDFGDLKVGDRIAYLGYPFPLTRYYSEGIVANVTRDYRGRTHLPDEVILPLTSLRGGPGSSGSAIIDMRTGHIIGVLSTGIHSSEGAVLGVGVTSIEDLPAIFGEVSG